jgi:NADH-quinone oxidoreductase subunit C
VSAETRSVPAEPASIARLRALAPPCVADVTAFAGDLVVVVPRERILEAARHLRDDAQLRFELLLDVLGDDLGVDAEPRFAVVYNFYALSRRERLLAKVLLREDDPTVDSLVPLYPSANWFEREAFDMVGVRFRGHPDPRRILMPESYEHFPLRKDFPTVGLGSPLTGKPPVTMHAR